MKRKRYTEEKIISILKGHETGASAPDLSRRHGVSEQSMPSDGVFPIGGLASAEGP